mgnify:CR=1 FL=1
MRYQHTENILVVHALGKINVDTDIRLAVTRNMKEFFAKNPDKQNSASIGAIYELLERGTVDHNGSVPAFYRRFHRIKIFAVV